MKTIFFCAQWNTTVYCEAPLFCNHECKKYKARKIKKEVKK